MRGTELDLANIGLFIVNIRRSVGCISRGNVIGNGIEIISLTLTQNTHMQGLTAYGHKHTTVNININIYKRNRVANGIGNGPYALILDMVDYCMKLHPYACFACHCVLLSIRACTQIYLHEQ